MFEIETEWKSDKDRKIKNRERKRERKRERERGMNGEGHAKRQRKAERSQWTHLNGKFKRNHKESEWLLFSRRVQSSILKGPRLQKPTHVPSFINIQLVLIREQNISWQPTLQESESII